MLRVFTKKGGEVITKKEFKKLLKKNGASIPKKESIQPNNTYDLCENGDIKLSIKKTGEVLFGIISAPDSNNVKVKKFIML